MNSENKWLYYLNKLIGIVGISVLFTVCSIPVFTIGVSLTALHEAVICDIEKGGVDKFFVFQKSLRKNMGGSTIIWLILLLGYAVFGGLAYFFSKSGDELMSILLACPVMVLSLITMILMYVFPLQARFEKKVIKQIKNALLLSVKCFPITVILAFMLAVFVIFFYFKTDVFLVFFCLFGFGAFAYVYDYFMLKCFRPYMEPLFKDEDKKNDMAHEAEKSMEEETVSEDEPKEEKPIEKETYEKADDENEKQAANKLSEVKEDTAFAPKKKSIELTDAAEDERKRKEEKLAAIEEAKKKEQEAADLAARNAARELAERVKESTVYETTGDNIYRRTISEEKTGRGVNRQKKKQRIK